MIWEKMMSDYVEYVEINQQILATIIRRESLFSGRH